MSVLRTAHRPTRKQLLGKYLVRVYLDETTIGRIVETEAYMRPENQTCRCERINVWWHMSRVTLATQ
ncbi:MAG: DNA-3-methyladenine glycosylase [Deltaproteobacteria bacterium]|nr:DNA-3-methyladenine glycosylase [Deltaproteobacteria bacterium]MDZ4343359.1 DNA-3-methyladenine glycosylase [Candidatus Binatia bacterium]